MIRFVILEMGMVAWRGARQEVGMQVGGYLNRAGEG